MTFLLTVTGCCALIGHVALWTGLLNQIVARNLPSLAVRLTEKSLLLLTAGLPFCLGPWWYAGHRAGSLVTTWGWPALQAYVYGCAGLAVVVIIRKTTEQYWSTAVRVPTTGETITVRRSDGTRPLHGRLTRLLGALPGNQICELEVNEKRLGVPGLAGSLAGYAVVHLSDLHFTGRMTREFYERVMQAAHELKGEAIVLTGDIVDYARYLDWLEMLGDLRAPDGCYFVLGNHDKRVGNVEIVRRRLHDAGWVSLGGSSLRTTFRGQPVFLAGNEMPWLGPAPSNLAPPGDATLRLALLHSPDQWPWAREHGFHLAVAGHTHGGQVRVPGYGAVLTPSRFGTRYACGVFYERPTVLHVSRGVSALHPVRYFCRPEITRLVLTPT